MKLRSENLTWRELDGVGVVLDLKSSKYLRTNATGTTLLRRLSDDASRADLVAALVDTYGISAEQAQTDTDAFLDDLRSLDMLVE